MNFVKEIYSIQDLIDLKKNDMIRANSEYQRGVVWTLPQKKKLIDSVLRGYPLPVIYLHDLAVLVRGRRSDSFDIVDGQQRINALYEYSEGAFDLFDPIKDDAVARFPAFIREQPCPWGGKRFSELPNDLRDRFLTTPLTIAELKTDNVNEIRDLFIRLQSGLPLNHQETRDAWPGDFTNFILRIGGKPELPRYPGHPFFVRVLGMKPQSDRGKTRQLAAQMAILFFQRRRYGMDFFCDINAAALNDYYYSNLDFEERSEDAKRFTSILTRLEDALAIGKRPKLRGHEAIHLLLLADNLLDEYTSDWPDHIGPAIDKFLYHFSQSKVNARDSIADDFWLHYGQWTRTNSDAGDTIRRRHRFYCRKMHEYMPDIKLKDKSRSFGELDRVVFYYEQEQKCAVCSAKIDWQDLEIHHVLGHARGGQTNKSNAAIVHRECHPKGEIAAKKFAAEWAALSRAPSSTEE